MNVFSLKKLVFVLSTISVSCCSQVNMNSRTSATNKIDHDSYNYVVEHFDEIGKNDSPLLNNAEGEFFNLLFYNQKEQCNFCNKRIIIFGGPSGRLIKNKKSFLLESVDSINSVSIQKSSCSRQMLILPKEVSDETGYDIAVSFAMKLPLTTEHVMKYLRKKQSVRDQNQVDQ